MIVQTHSFWWHLSTSSDREKHKIRRSSMQTSLRNRQTSSGFPKLLSDHKKVGEGHCFILQILALKFCIAITARTGFLTHRDHTTHQETPKLPPKVTLWCLERVSDRCAYTAPKKWSLDFPRFPSNDVVEALSCRRLRFLLRPNAMVATSDTPNTPVIDVFQAP